MIPIMPVPVHVENRSIGSGMKLHSIQCMRFIAATIVVIYHAYVSFVPSALTAPAVGAAYIFGFGKVGVHIFFVISGYIMYLTSFGRPGRFRTGQFFLRRVVRIYPIYWIFVALYLTTMTIIGIRPALSMTQLLGALALVPPYAPLVIGPAWTLAYEVYFYIAFGLIMVLGALRGTVVLTAVFIGSIALGVLLRPEHPLVAMATNGLLLEFCMGVWVARLTTCHTQPLGVGLLAVTGAVCLYGAGLILGYGQLPSALTWGVPSALLVAGVVILDQRGHTGVMRRFSWLGDSSYVLYLCHILLIEIVMALLRTTGLMPLLLVQMIATTIGCIVFAALFHVVIERPLTTILHRAISPRRTIAGSGKDATDHHIPCTALRRDR
ncbi:acyltransferase [Sphingomonas sp. MA1305]|uniref:acyltransferase family protein n=1 Tax=Sphingomonas sp. MA1305 TaxID=2479204 RepID=UPI0018DF96FE|nr:acyltransferase [Sphingomonas sp. MA1305]MBI0477229.1 acyltransferase [Sphingomonas sp. MA1305]